MTNLVFDDDLALKAGTAYTNFKNDIESELVSILESNALVESAKVKVTDIQENARVKRSAAELIVHFESACYVRVAEISNMTAISTVLFESITNSQSFSPADFQVEEPQVIITNENKTRIDEGISKSIMNVQSIRLSLINLLF